MRDNFKLMFPKKRKPVKVSSEFDRTFNRLYGDTWVVVRCGGLRKLQVQRDVINAVLELAEKHGFRDDYEIEMSRSAQQTEREEVTVRYQNLGCFRGDGYYK